MGTDGLRDRNVTQVFWFIRVHLDMPHCTHDRLTATRVRGLLHSCTSVLFAVAWLGCLPSFRHVDTGTQITLMLSLVGLVSLWHSRLIHWIADPITQSESLSEQIRETLHSMPEGLLVTDKKNRIVMANETLLSSIGLSSDQVIGKRPGSLSWVTSEGTHSRDLPWVQSTADAQPKQEQLMRYKMPGGSERFFSINASPVIGERSEQEGSVVTIRDVTQIEEHRAELEQMLMKLRCSRDEVQTQNRELQILANQDPLTGCLNRRSFFEGFRAAWSDSVEEDTRLSCLMIDVDHFKRVNDDHGHQVGDSVLKAVSMVLRQSFTSPATVGRYGGEEFCVMVPHTDAESSTALAEHVRKRIESIRFSETPHLQITASFGVSSRMKGVEKMEDLIRQADECLYHAKNTGRNQVLNRDAFVSAAESVL